MEVIVGEIPTEVCLCFWCGEEIDHDCVEAKYVPRTRRATRYMHVLCFEETANIYIDSNKWKLTRYTLNPKE